MDGYELKAEVQTYGYDWSAVGVFAQKATGRLFYATDSGCSCNAAWDSTTDADLTPLTRDNLNDLLKEARGIDAERGDLITFIGTTELLLD